MPEFPNNLWAPWRMEYIAALGKETGERENGGCFLCQYRDAPADDAKNLVIARAGGILVIMNRFPYSNGHLLVAPADHRPDLADFTDARLADLMRATRDAKSVLVDALGAHGFNIGINFGRCAGAGLPDHLHVHVVPRWNGDTNFMAVIGDARVIPEALEQTYARLCASASRLGLFSD